MGVQAAIRKYGERAEAAVYKEIKQLDEMEALVPVHKWKGPHKPLECIVQVTEKCDEQRTLKGRACADGRGQRDYFRKEETSSPTVSVEALMLSCIIDAYENRDVATVDVPGAFLQTAMDDLVYMTIRGDAARQLVKANPDKYGSFLKTGKRGEPYIITKLKKAVYGTLKASKLFWMVLTRFLEDDGFVVNPFDQCVANKVINGTQATITWHVDGLKISHVNPQVVTDLIGMLNSRFGTVKPLSENRGKIHDYLEMRIDFSDLGKVVIDMRAYLREVLGSILDEFLEGGERMQSPAGDHLFTVNEKAAKLSVKLKEFFIYC